MQIRRAGSGLANTSKPVGAQPVSAPFSSSSAESSLPVAEAALMVAGRPRGFQTESEFSNPPCGLHNAPKGKRQDIACFLVAFSTLSGMLIARSSESLHRYRRNQTECPRARGPTRSPDHAQYPFGDNHALFVPATGTIVFSRRAAIACSTRRTDTMFRDLF